MSAQPANTDIQVFQRVRTVRNIRRQDTVENIVKHLRPMIMVIPGKEVLSEIKTRDATMKDFSVYGRDGMPVVIGAKSDITFTNAQENLPGVTFAVKIGADRFIENSSAHLANDLFADAQALS